jgi:hypothetical protein
MKNFKELKFSRQEIAIIFISCLCVAGLSYFVSEQTAIITICGYLLIFAGYVLWKLKK